MTTTVKITELSNIGANLSYTTLIPVVSTVGMPITQKSNLQAVGNMILSGAGGVNFVPAYLANLAYSVTNAAQPNITSVGTLSSLNVSGNIISSNANLGNLARANFFQGDGGLLSNITSSGSEILNGNSNVSVAANSDVTIGVAGSTWVFDDNGNITLPSGNSSINYANGDPYGGSNANIGNFVFTSNTMSLDGTGNSSLYIQNDNTATAKLTIPSSTDADTVELIVQNTGNAGVHIVAGPSEYTWHFDNTGNFNAPGNAILSGSQIFAGPGADSLGLADPTLVISSNSTAFIQAVINNVSDIGSADWVAQGHLGDDDGGWVDLGFTSASFSDPNYTITGPGDGYIFAQGFWPGQAPSTGGGNLILATGNEGSTKDIIFGTGGFDTANIFGRISDANNAFEISRASAYIKLPGTGTIDNPANSSLDPLNPNVSTMVLTPDLNYTSQALVLDPTAPGHIHLRAPGANIDEPYANLFLGGEETSFEIGAYYGGPPNAFVHSNSHTWTFSSDGNLVLPGNTIAINYANGSASFGNMVEWTTVPVANTSNGSAGQAAYDSGGNLYVCVATDTWAKFTGTISW